MKNILFLLEKEFKQIFRNPTILRMILMMPIVQLILIPFAADYEVKNISITVVDLDHSSYSKRLIGKIEASPYFILSKYASSFTEALVSVENEKADIVLTIPQNFEKDLIKEDKTSLHIAANGVNIVKAGLGVSYATQLLNKYNIEIREEWIQLPKQNPFPKIDISSSNWYNPYINYHLYMVPGILAILVTMVGSFLTALNIVAEKEVGTIEQLNVTPLKKHEFILGKLIPFWVLGLVSITLGMAIGYLVFGLTPVGSFLTIYLFSAVYLIGILGIGLLISTYVETQQQATLFAFFFMMIFILMGGLYTPLESMPEWAYNITRFNPPQYFIRVIRSIYIKGSAFKDLLPDFLAMVGFALVFNIWAILNYRKKAA